MIFYVTPKFFHCGNFFAFAFRQNYFSKRLQSTNQRKRRLFPTFGEFIMIFLCKIFYPITVFQNDRVNSKIRPRYRIKTPFPPRIELLDFYNRFKNPVPPGSRSIKTPSRCGSNPNFFFYRGALVIVIRGSKIRPPYSKSAPDPPRIS